MQAVRFFITGPKAEVCLIQHSQIFMLDGSSGCDKLAVSPSFNVALRCHDSSLLGLLGLLIIMPAAATGHFLTSDLEFPWTA